MDTVERLQSSVNAAGYSRVHLGDVYNYGVPPPQSQAEINVKSFGVCLGYAPQIDADAFKGRRRELQQLREWLLPTDRKQARIVSIVGLGGMGKTQLSLAHVRECADQYSSVFWLNAKDQTSIRQDITAASSVVFPEFGELPTSGTESEQQAIEKFLRWLSEPANDRWLLIFDNYDDPQLPGIRSSTGYDIRPFFPTRSQGSILITTRSTKLAFSKQLHLKQIDDIHTSIAVLSQRSNTQLSEDDNDAVRLASRLGGLPLALATAGTYLGSASISCGEYLDLYQSMWTELFGVDAEELFEYEARTLSSTWSISLQQVRMQDPDAAELLEFLAFFSPRDIWYELIQAGSSELEHWMSRVTKSKVHFQRAMTKLCNYSLVDVEKGSYQMHPCLHDWLVESLTESIPSDSFIAAVTCIARTITTWNDTSYWMTGQRLLDHIKQLESERFSPLWSTHIQDGTLLWAAETIAQLEADFDQFSGSEALAQQVLAVKEATLGPDHPSILKTVALLAGLYHKQRRSDDTEQMVKRAVSLCMKLKSWDDTPTFILFLNVARLCVIDRSLLTDAEELLKQTLANAESILGLEHKSTLDTVETLGDLYLYNGMLEQAEEMLSRSLAGKEKILLQDHPSTLQTMCDLGRMYQAWAKPELAIEMFERALAGQERWYGPVSSPAINTLSTLAALYDEEGRADEAEHLFSRGIQSYSPLLRNGKLSDEDADNFARLLSRSIRSGTIDLSMSSSRLCNLIQLIRAKGQEGSAGHHLSKALAYSKFDDEQNAQVAFRYAIKHVDGEPSKFGALCDGCDADMNVETGRHVCRQCADIDLCSLCMDIYSEGALFVPNCANHAFLQVDVPAATPTSPVSESAAAVGGAKWHAWIDGLLKKYSALATPAETTLTLRPKSRATS